MICINGIEYSKCDLCGGFYHGIFCDCRNKDSKENKKLKEIMESIRAKNEVIVIITPNYQTHVRISSRNINIKMFKNHTIKTKRGKPSHE